MQLARPMSARTVILLSRSFSAIGLFSVAVLSLSFIVWTPSWAHSNSLPQTFVGYAYEGDGKALLYKEIHHQTVDENGETELNTLYLGPGGETIATRTVNFSGDALAPQFRLRDNRAGYSEGLYRKDTKTYVFRHLPDSQDQEIREIDDQEGLVADAGFDRLVVSNWDQLLVGAKVRADFLVPARLRALKFVIEKEREWTLEDVPVVTFRMTSANPFLRIFIGAIRVTYHRDDRVLMVYEGLSNIRGPGEKSLDVRIEFPLAERNEEQAMRSLW